MDWVALATSIWQKGFMIKHEWLQILPMCRVCFPCLCCTKICFGMVILGKITSRMVSSTFKFCLRPLWLQFQQTSEQGSNHQHSLPELLEIFDLSWWCGASSSKAMVFRNWKHHFAFLLWTFDDCGWNKTI